MKMKSTIFLAIICAMLFSCKKHGEDQTTPASDKSSFFTKNTKQSQTFTVDVSNDNASITAAEGTMILIPKDAFLLPNGQPVNGPVTIEIKEIMNVNDMILSGITSASNGQILESGGEIFINATAQGQQLIIDPDTAIVIGVPKDSTNQEMQLFVGEGQGDNFNWQPVRQDSVGMKGQGQGGTVDFTQFFLYEDFFCTCYNATSYFTSIKTLGWQNIDCFYGNSSTIKNIAVSSPGFDKTNSSLFVILKNKNSAINVYADLAYHNGYYDLSLPDNEPITVVAIGNKDGKYYLDIKDFLVSSSLVIDLTMAETTEETIVNEINTRFDN
jgi:hypothetical protein